MTPQIIAALAGAAATLLSAGGWMGYRLGAADIAELRTEHAVALYRAADAATLTLYKAQQHADELTRQLAASRTANRKLTEERTREIQTVTDNRACLHEPALRLLDSAPGLALHLPPAPGLAHGADAAHVATDTDLARWALAAGERYAECASRYSALIDWHTKDKDTRK